MFKSNPREVLTNAVANKTANPFATALETGGKLITPLIKYGVNPVNGIPLTNDLLADIIDLTSSLKSEDGEVDMLVVGERRAAFINIFYSRAKLCFENAVQSLNNVHNAEIKQNFKGIYHQLTSRDTRYAYDPEVDYRNEKYNLFSVNFTRAIDYPYHNADSISLNRGTAKLSTNRYNIPKLYDLEYYMMMPIESILEQLLVAVSNDYARALDAFSGYKFNRTNDDDIIREFNDYKGYLGVAYANLLASSEAIVLMLYSEANTLIQSAYPNQFGMEYDTAKAISLAAENDAYYDLCYNAKIKELKV